MSTEELTGPKIVSLYNSMALKLGKNQVKKFRTLADAKKRLEAITQEVHAKNTIPIKPRKNSIDRAAVIVVLKKEVKGRETDARKRFKALASLADLITVGEFVEKGYGKPNDLRWWEERGMIRIGKDEQ